MVDKLVKTDLATTCRRYLRGTLIGVGAGALVSTIATAIDWRQNPGGLFRGVDGSHWDVVFETAFSWFWPVTLAATIIAIATLLLLHRQ